MGYRCLVVEDYVDFVDGQQFMCFFSKQWLVRCWVNNNGFQYFIVDVVFCVLLVDQYQYGVFQSGFGNCYGVGQRVQNIDFDVGGCSGSGDCGNGRSEQQFFYYMYFFGGIFVVCQKCCFWDKKDWWCFLKVLLIC